MLLGNEPYCEQCVGLQMSRCLFPPKCLRASLACSFSHCCRPLRPCPFHPYQLVTHSKQGADLYHSAKYQNLLLYGNDAPIFVALPVTCSAPFFLTDGGVGAWQDEQR